MRLPTLPEFETIFLEDDQLMAVLPEHHPLAGCSKFPVGALCDDPFMLLEKGAKAEISEILSGAASLRTFILQHGMTTPSCPWWRAGWESVSCRSSSCRGFLTGLSRKN